MSRDQQDDGHDDWPHGWSVRWVAETGSTNADLVDAANAGAPNWSVLATDFQAAGRGRLDRSWQAPPGANLLVSLLLRDAPADPHHMVQRVALAALVASKRVAGVDAVLKWPNDLLVDGGKLAGVLAESGTGGREPFVGNPFVVVGIGLNVGWAPAGAAKLGAAIAPRSVLRELLTAFDELPLDIAPLYRSHLATIGRAVRVELMDDRVIVGRAVSVEDDGRLIVLDDCAVTHRIGTGDVVHLRS